MQTHFISNSKSYLHCGKQHQSWRAATTRLNMFSGLQISFLQLNYINHNISRKNITSVAPWQSGWLRSALGLVRNSKRVLFAGLAFARVMILTWHSEAKWRQLPWLHSETLFSGCRLALQCTKVERSSRPLHERSFANLQALQAGPL